MIKKLLCVAAIAAVAVFGFFFVRDCIGVSEENLEADARESQRINGDWLVSKSSSDKIAAMIFYPESLDDHVFSVYAKEESLCFGYFFKAGGGIFMDDVVAEFKYNDTSAYMSMNKINISKIEVIYSEKTEIIEIDSEKPFVFALPDGATAALFYDVDGNKAEIESR